MMRRPHAGVDALTKREMEVAELVAEGHSNRAIGSAVSIGEQSVKNVVSAILRKLDCSNRVQIALKIKELS